MATAFGIIVSPVLQGASAASEATRLADLGPGVEEPQPRGDGEVTIAWVGDMTLGSRYGTPPDDGRPLFAKVLGPLQRADLTLGNLEGTLGVGGASKCGADAGNCFSFQAPPGHAASLVEAGFDVVNLANNHAYDFGEEGRRQTVDALRTSGVAHTGLPGQVTVVERDGVRVALVGFAPYPWAPDLRDLDAARALVRDADGRADLVVVMMHAGAEGSDRTHVPVGREVAMGEDRGDTRAFAHAVVEAGADLVLGSGPHVLRGIELHRGRLVAYSLGNFAGWHNFSTSGALALSGVLTVTVSRDGWLRGGRLRSLRLGGPGVPAPDPSAASLALVRELSATDFGAAGLRLLDDGSF